MVTAFGTNWGGRIFDDDWNPTINAPEALKATEFLRLVFRTGPENMETFSFGQSTFDFLSGGAAIYLGNLKVGAALRDPSFSALSENISFVGHPRDKACSAETGGFAIGIPENSENKEAAFLLLQYLTSKEGDRRTLNFANSWMRRDTTTLLLCSNVLSA